MSIPSVTKTSEIVVNTATANRFFGNPSIVSLSNGHLIATHDEFGSATDYLTGDGGKSFFYRSTDSGETWTLLGEKTGLMAGAMFRLAGSDDLYKYGDTHSQGDIGIMKSTDGGTTWGSITEIKTGGSWQVQSIQPLILDGFVVCAVFRFDGSWPPKQVEVGVCDVTDDLTNAANWTWSNNVADAIGYLEFSAVPSTGGFTLLGRRHSIHKGVRVPVTWDSSTPSITLGTPVVYEQLGGDVMWEVAYHSEREKYYAIVNPHTDWDLPANQQRNRLELIEATDPAGPWTPIRQIVFNAPDIDSTGSATAGFQYCGFLREPDGTLSGSDLVFVSRVGFAPTVTGGTGHNSNRIWFHRISNGFTQTRKQWSISKSTSIASELTAIADGDLTLTGTAAHESAGWTVVKGVNASEPVTSAIGPDVQRASDSRYHTTLDRTAMERARALGYLIEI